MWIRTSRKSPENDSTNCQRLQFKYVYWWAVAYAGYFQGRCLANSWKGHFLFLPPKKESDTFYFFLPKKDSHTFIYFFKKKLSHFLKQGVGVSSYMINLSDKQARKKKGIKWGCLNPPPPPLAHWWIQICQFCRVSPLSEMGNKMVWNGIVLLENYQ